MNHLCSKRLFNIFISILCLSAVVSAVESPALKIFPPANGEIRLENFFGDIEVAVWQETYIGVSTSVLPSGIKKSPLELERSETGLYIKVSAGLSENQYPVALKLNVPANSRLRISTGKGTININGLPASLSAHSVSGDINFNLPENPDFSLNAHSVKGSVISAENKEIKTKYQSRRGAGSARVNLSSETGIIRLSNVNRSTDIAGARENVTTKRNGGRQGEAPLPPVLKNEAPAAARSNRPVNQPSVDAPLEVDEDEVVKVETDLVTLNASVVERSTGRVITGLRREDFKIEEDGVEQKIEHFETVNAPFDLLLLIDLSGSTAKVADIIRAATKRFVSATRPQDRIAILAFSGTTIVVSPFTSNKSALNTAVNSMQSPNGDTKLYDGINYALDYIDKESAGTRRKAIIVMSDGLDSELPNVAGSGSILPYKTIYSRAQEFDGMIYCIWTNTEYEAHSPLDIQPETFDLAYDQLYDLSEAGSGLFYEVEKLEDLAGIYEKVISDLGTVYSLSFNPTNKGRDGRLRQVRLRLPTKPGAVARAKQSYTR
ncbi:MAG TPA: VWA domain-containing protein [Pyrinomonadaceae bacterium]|nr:VWA domain-containing protein [Pyrinomonadaceae bacterium]